MSSNKYCVIMAGGIGTRFWPKSRQSMPKQFLDILGTGKSFIRHTYERFAKMVPAENFLVVTNDKYKSLVLEHIPEIGEKQVLCEPVGRNTAPCVAYAAYTLLKRNPDAEMIVTPNLIGGIVLGYIWQFVFSRVFVSIGETTGWSLFEISWLSTPNKAFAALVLVSVWQLAGYMILIYVAGFMGLSEDVLEAASIDGASGWVKMKNIILPLMMSSVTICLFLTLSRAFMVYDVNLSLTGGAPYGTTEMAAMHVYEKAFTSRQFGVGQAEAFILFIIVACISGIQVYTTKKREVEA